MLLLLAIGRRLFGVEPGCDQFLLRSGQLLLTPKGLLLNRVGLPSDAAHVGEEGSDLEGGGSEPLIGGGPIRSLRAACHDAEADFGGHFLLPRQQVSEQLLRDGPCSVVCCSLPFALVDGDRNCFLVSLDQDWASAIAGKG
jgi:hypothetical protein